jgi:glycosyltransferase involved in cell wall biosynthesis
MVAALLEIPRTKRPGRRAAAALRSALSRTPYPVALYRSSRFAAALARRLDVFRPDALVGQSYHMASYLCGRPAAAVDFHNVDSEIWSRLAFQAGPTPFGMFCRWQARRVRDFERTTLGRVGLATCVAARDAETLARLAPAREDLRIRVVENGVELDRRPFRADPPAGEEILFVGDLGWRPNADGIGWFAKDVWPAIASARPAARVRVIGRNAPRRLRPFVRARFDLPGEVPDTDRDFLDAAVFVVPLRVGGGTRLKILEAAASGVPVVSTSRGAEGLDLADGDEIVIRDTPADFAAAVAGLLADPAARRSLAVRARRAVETRYDVRAIGSRYAEEICRLAESAGAASRGRA